jgi:hypothetical protein
MKANSRYSAKLQRIREKKAIPAPKHIGNETIWENYYYIMHELKNINVILSNNVQNISKVLLDNNESFVSKILKLNQDELDFVNGCIKKEFLSEGENYSEKQIRETLYAQFEDSVVDEIRGFIIKLTQIKVSKELIYRIVKYYDETRNKLPIEVTVHYLSFMQQIDFIKNTSIQFNSFLMTSFSFLHDKKSLETIPLNRELKRIISLFENSFQEVDFITEIDELNEAYIRINIIDLTVILNNVLLNAIKHSKNKIYLTSHISTKEHRVYFTIRNSVGGTTTLNEVGNLGIGLKLSKKLLSQYDSFAYFNVNKDFFSVTLSFPLYEAKTEL